MTWTPENEEEKTKQPQVLEYKVKVHVALEASDSETWGIAKDTEGDVTWKTGEGLVIGTWSKSPHDNLIHVFLETPLAALVDKATQRFVEYAERREAVRSAPKGTRTRAPRTRPEQIVESENLATISSLRKKIGR